VRPTLNREIDIHGGEFALESIDLEWLQFTLVGIFGFLPLIIVHFSTRRFRLVIIPSPTRRQQYLARLVAIKTSLLMLLTDWFSSIV